MNKKLCELDNYNECIICFDNISSNYCTTCKICGISVHNHCWNDWIHSSGKYNICVHCGQQNCIESKRQPWYITLLYCLFHLLPKKNKSI
jgi:hypothetical protein